MARRWTLGNPHPEHVPTLGRWETGNPSRRNGRTRIGTTLTCSCTGVEVRVSRRAPSTSAGRAVAGIAYRLHLAQAGEVCAHCNGTVTHDLGDDDVCTSCGKRWERLDPEPEPGMVP